MPRLPQVTATVMPGFTWEAMASRPSSASTVSRTRSAGMQVRSKLWRTFAILGRGVSQIKSVTTFMGLPPSYKIAQPHNGGFHKV